MPEYVCRFGGPCSGKAVSSPHERRQRRCHKLTQRACNLLLARFACCCCSNLPLLTAALSCGRGSSGGVSAVFCLLTCPASVGTALPRGVHLLLEELQASVPCCTGCAVTTQGWHHLLLGFCHASWCACELPLSVAVPRSKSLVIPRGMCGVGTHVDNRLVSCCVQCAQLGLTLHMWLHRLQSVC